MAINVAGVGDIGAVAAARLGAADQQGIERKQAKYNQLVQYDQHRSDMLAQQEKQNDFAQVRLDMAQHQQEAVDKDHAFKMEQVNLANERAAMRDDPFAEAKFAAFAKEADEIDKSPYNQLLIPSDPNSPHGGKEAMKKLMAQNADLVRKYPTFMAKYSQFNYVPTHKQYQAQEDAEFARAMARKQQEWDITQKPRLDQQKELEQQRQDTLMARDEEKHKTELKAAQFKLEADRKEAADRLKRQDVDWVTKQASEYRKADPLLTEEEAQLRAIKAFSSLHGRPFGGADDQATTLQTRVDAGKMIKEIELNDPWGRNTGDDPITLSNGDKGTRAELTEKYTKIRDGESSGASGARKPEIHSDLSPKAQKYIPQIVGQSTAAIINAWKNPTVQNDPGYMEAVYAELDRRARAGNTVADQAAVEILDFIQRRAGMIKP